jgi:hypothetical protein
LFLQDGETIKIQLGIERQKIELQRNLKCQLMNQLNIFLLNPLKNKELSFKSVILIAFLSTAANYMNINKMRK